MKTFIYDIATTTIIDTKRSTNLMIAAHQTTITRVSAIYLKIVVRIPIAYEYHIIKTTTLSQTSINIKIVCGYSDKPRKHKVISISQLLGISRRLPILWRLPLPLIDVESIEHNIHSKFSTNFTTDTYLKTISSAKAIHIKNVTYMQTTTHIQTSTLTNKVIHIEAGTNKTMSNNI